MKKSGVDNDPTLMKAISDANANKFDILITREICNRIRLLLDALLWMFLIYVVVHV